MNEHQPLAVYNEGPHFVFESFAILNELLLLQHLVEIAPSPQAKAYYLHQLLEDATFQVYGSARETDLEQSIYVGVHNGSLRTAADLDGLTLEVFSRYLPGPAMAPQMKVYWARNRLYFTDPLYDVNYLLAGVLALNYLERLESDAARFRPQYLALLQNGFTDTPEVLLRRFLDIDITDARGLLAGASRVIDTRAARLEQLYGLAPRPVLQ
jgi:oligoendopeptidase F